MNADIALKCERVGQRLDNLSASFDQLRSALSRDTEHDEVLRGGLIQFFEFTFELCWKTMKDMLEVDGIIAHTPRDVIKEAFQAGYIADGKTWIEMLDARNEMSHAYKEQAAVQAEKDIRGKYAPLITALYEYITHTWLG